MRLRNIATAFLLNGDDILMMQRSQNRRIAPGFWYGVGGHIEPDELNDPERACRREVLEETGLDAAHISGLRLRYIVLRQSHEEMVINYFFFGQTDTREVQTGDEGTLHWVPCGEALDRRLFPAIGLTLKHFLETRNEAEAGSASSVQLGLVTLADGQPVIQWNEIMDWADPAG